MSAADQVAELISAAKLRINYAERMVGLSAAELRLLASSPATPATTLSALEAVIGRPAVIQVVVTERRPGA